MPSMNHGHQLVLSMFVVFVVVVLVESVDVSPVVVVFVLVVVPPVVFVARFVTFVLDDVFVLALALLLIWAETEAAEYAITKSPNTRLATKPLENDCLVRISIMFK